MPEAAEPNTAIPSGIVAAMFAIPPLDEGGAKAVVLTVRRQPNETQLLAACQAVTARRQAMELISQSVAEIDPVDPMHAAAYRMVGDIRPSWLEGIGRVCTTPAKGSRGLFAKATLLASLVERDDDDQVVGGAAMQVAASLADDVLLAGDG